MKNSLQINSLKKIVCAGLSLLIIDLILTVPKRKCGPKKLVAFRQGTSLVNS